MVPHLHVAKEQEVSRCCDETEGAPVKPFSLSLHWTRSFPAGLAGYQPQAPPGISVGRAAPPSLGSSQGSGAANERFLVSLQRKQILFFGAVSVVSRCSRRRSHPSAAPGRLRAASRGGGRAPRLPCLFRGESGELAWKNVDKLLC